MNNSIHNNIYTNGGTHGLSSSVTARGSGTRDDPICLDD
jgi:hypothetical protein